MQAASPETARNQVLLLVQKLKQAEDIKIGLVTEHAQTTEEKMQLQSQVSKLSRELDKENQVRFLSKLASPYVTNPCLRAACPSLARIARPGAAAVGFVEVGTRGERRRN
jgi:hypothetical protein